MHLWKGHMQMELQQPDTAYNDYKSGHWDPCYKAKKINH